MTTNRFAFLSLLVAAFAASTVSIAIAQPPGEIPIQPDLTGRMFTIRVVNGTGMPIYYKLVGGPGKSFVHQTLRPEGSELERGVTGGDKALCVWRANEQTLLAVWMIHVDQNGKIVIPSMVPLPEAPAGAPKPSEAPAGPSPRLRITPE